ncbi:MAG: hypothetical protein M3Q05_08815, partial [Bacteroidota bacterium]|nr:hypothetical protein [Bacteroidota bacterium]
MAGNERQFHTEWIERYLSGELQGEELERFIQRLHLDSAFRQEVAVQRSIVAQAQLIGREDLRQDLKSLHRQFGFNQSQPGINQDNFNQTKTKTKTIPVYLYAVAATILL